VPAARRGRRRPRGRGAPAAPGGLLGGTTQRWGGRLKTLALWAGGSAGDAARLLAQQATAVLWRESGAPALEAAGVRFVRLRGLLPPAERDAIDEAAIAWTKAWGRAPLLDGRSFRELVAWKGESLWWLAELYLHHSTRAPGYVRLVETLLRLLERERPDEVEAFGLPWEEELLLSRVCTARGVLYQGRAAPRRSRLALRTLRVRLESRWNGAKALATRLKASFAGAPARTRDGRRGVLFLSHAAFWRERRDASGRTSAYEHYFDRLIPETAAQASLRVDVVALGPRAAFRRRGARERVRDWLRLEPPSGPFLHVDRFCDGRVLAELRRAGAELRRSWRKLRASPGMAEAFSHRGVRFADLGGPELAATMLLQLPWGVRCYEEMLGALDALAPEVVCLYAESSGWGRAALLACRARGVRSLALQHGILYPKYYSYRHDADEQDSPRPDRTAVFGEAAVRFLREQGGYAEAALVVTGSPKFDDLLHAARAWERDALRRRLGVAAGERLLVVASRHRGIRETHQSIGSAFPGLARAVEALDGVRCVVKPHPAEPPDAYAAEIAAAGATRVALATAGEDLIALLHAADALVTVESLSAVEALVLGRPVLILNMPTNLRALVEQGVALGVDEGADPLPALRLLLFDAGTRQRLDAARARYLSDVAHGVDGAATARILELLRSMAGASSSAAAPDEMSRSIIDPPPRSLPT
jgi:hypothetical protein